MTKSFGNRFTLVDLDQEEVYKLTMRAHNPTGFSAPVVIRYPVN